MQQSTTGVVVDTPIAADGVLQNDEYSGTLRIVGEPFTEELYGIAVETDNDEVLALGMTRTQALRKVILP
ncbi:MAG: hypothetical protein ACOC2D_11290 [Spirochaetota bacterium]